jgi:hypothetical protein
VGCRNIFDLGLSCGSLDGCWSLSVYPIEPEPNPRLRALWVCLMATGSKPGLCFWRCQDGRPRRGRPAWDFAQFCSILVHLPLKSKLIQNVWNSLEINRIWMEYSVKLMLFPRSWRHRMWIYGRQHAPWSALAPWPLTPRRRNRPVNPLLSRLTPAKGLFAMIQFLLRTFLQKYKSFLNWTLKIHRKL